MIKLHRRRNSAPRIDSAGHVIGHDPITPLNEMAIIPEPTTGCWLWVGSMSGETGYGQIGCNFNGKHITKRAHRVIYETHNGPIPDGLELDHLCRTRQCVNPEHLEPVTRKENSRRGMTIAAILARSAAKKYCANGHPYIPENIFVDTRGHRQCRECTRAARARHYRKSKGEV